MKNNIIILHFTDGHAIEVCSWAEASKYTYRIAHVISPSGRIVKKIFGASHPGYYSR